MVTAGTSNEAAMQRLNERQRLGWRILAAPDGRTIGDVNGIQERCHRPRRLDKEIVEPYRPGHLGRSVAGDPVTEPHADAHSTTSSGRWLTGPSLVE